MAKSKSGGTRAYLRGRIANDVYSVGKDGAGKKQQVVRSLAETVANPQTPAQMRGRIIMSTVMQGVSAACLLVDHSFDGVPTGQPSLSEFIKRNYALIKADIAANPVTGNKFALNEYQQKGIKCGAWQMSQGKAILPSALLWDATFASGLLNINKADATAKDVRDLLNMSADDYFTMIGLTKTNNFLFTRFHISNQLADDTVITAENVAQLFEIDDPEGFSPKLDFTSGAGSAISFTWNSDLYSADCAGCVIISRAVDGGYEHNTAIVNVQSISLDDSYEVVRDTYPEGTQRFLNGGEL